MSLLKEIRDDGLKAVGKSDAYLTSFYCHIDSDNNHSEWIVHYYDQINDMMYSYNANTKSVQGPLEVFKEQDFVPELDLDEVNCELDDALETAREAALPVKDYKKIVVVLQTIEEFPVWNITLLSSSLQALNVRIDARHGDLIRKEPIELFEFKSD
ncbi:MAG: hypothetical protein ACMXYL_00830 [Candidatus Woesearchaeota archaeon]